LLYIPPGSLTCERLPSAGMASRPRRRMTIRTAQGSGSVRVQAAHRERTIPMKERTRLDEQAHADLARVGSAVVTVRCGQRPCRPVALGLRLVGLAQQRGGRLRADQT